MCARRVCEVCVSQCVCVYVYVYVCVYSEPFRGPAHVREPGHRFRNCRRAFQDAIIWAYALGVLFLAGSD